MASIAIIPVDGEHEFSMFKKTVSTGVDLKAIKSMLFVKLYELLEDIHKDKAFPVWGISSGEKSSDANKWNKISQNDFVFFTKNKRLIAFGKVEAKFQSGNIAQALWPEIQNSQDRQYLLTLSNFNVIQDKMHASISAICRRGSIHLDSFQIVNNDASFELLKVFELDSFEQIGTLSGQAFGLTAAEKRVVEMHAVRVAINHLSILGFNEIEDVGERESFDLLASSVEKQLSVEVKGSTGPANSVILTKNEVHFQKEAYPSNGLFIVSNIELVRGDIISAQGGDIEFISPWLINESDLEPISFHYKI